MLVAGKEEANTLSTLHGIANCAKNGTTRKIVSSNRCQMMQRRPQLLLGKFRTLFIFRKENSTLEMNVSHFEVLHWQQWKPSASATGHRLILSADEQKIESATVKVFSVFFGIFHQNLLMLCA